MRAPIFTSDQLLDQSGVETDEPSPNPSLEADKLKDYLEKMDPRTSGSSIHSGKDGRQRERGSCPRKTLVLTLLLLPVAFRPLRLAAQTIRSPAAPFSNDSHSCPRCARVVLHRVGPAACRARSTPPGPTAGPLSICLSSRHRRALPPECPLPGIEYFSAPLPTNPGRPDRLIRIMVYDTSSTAPVRLEARHLVLSPGPERMGTAVLLDLIVLRNSGRLHPSRARHVRPSLERPAAGWHDRASSWARAISPRCGLAPGRLVDRDGTARSGREAAHHSVPGPVRPPRSPASVQRNALRQSTCWRRRMP